MAAGTLSLTSSWWTADDWINPAAIAISITGTGAVEYLWEVGTPASAASGAPIPAGVYNLYGEPGYKPYFRVTSGSATLYYAKSSATPVETAKTGFAYSGDAGADEDFTASTLLQVGFDDLTTRAGDNPYEFAAYLPTVAAGLASGDSVSAAYLTLQLQFWTQARTLRAYGVKYATDQSGSITDWDTLQNRTKTTAYTDVTLGVSDIVTLDVTSIINELKAVSGWDGDSPIQLLIEDTGAVATGLNTLCVIDAARQMTQLAILLTSGGSPEPPDPGTGGP